jgi:4-carboxymuconolactone decarboxylase
LARIPYPDPKSLPDADREFLERLPQLNIHRMLAGSPATFQSMVRLFSSYLNEGVLDVELREIIILRVAHLRKSEYEVRNHQSAARVIGMSQERIQALEPGKDLTVFTNEERLVIQFVDEVVLDGAASKATFDAVSGFMNTAELLEATVVIGVYTMVSQICATFEIELEEWSISDSGIEDMGEAVSKL